MNIFVAGIHGVGKSYLASRTAESVGLLHTSASRLIKEERSLSTWSENKVVTDVDANQLALTNAIKRKNNAGISLLLDGHFVLLGEDHLMIRLESRVFESFNLLGVILIQEDPLIVAQRILERDKREENPQFLREFIDAEKRQAQVVCNDVNLPLIELMSATAGDFAEAIKKIMTSENACINR